MRNFKSYISLLAIGAAVLTACQNDFDNIDVPVPVATIQANTTINEVKTRYWNDATNYIDTIRLNDAGEHVVISGRVISSDASGNIYKSLVIQDATGAMAMSINANSMYQKYRMGQEVVVDLTDMFIGKYNGLQQLGFPEEYQDTYEATFMPYEFFEMHAQLNGLPEPAKVDTILVNSTADLSTSPEGLRKWQSQLVRFNNCHFEQGGQVAFTDGHKVTSNRNLILSDGNSIIVRTSGYSNFWSDMLPAGNGDVVGILSYFGTSGWQLLLNDRKGCMNFGNPTIGPGAEDNPYTVTEAIGIEQAGTSAKGWVTGYIVGAVAPGVTTVSSNDDIEFKADVTMDNTLVIAADPECKDFSQCLVFELPQDSKLRQYGNLVTNPSNYKKQMSLIGNLDKVYATYGVTGNNGTAAEFKIEGVEVPGDQPAEEGNGTKESPYNVSQVLALGNPGTSAWITGYIVGWVEGQALQSGAHFDANATSQSNILIAATPTETDVNKCIPIQLAYGTDARTALNLQSNPGNLGKKVSIESTLEKYFGVVGQKGSTAYEIDGNSGGGDTPVTPPAGDGDGTEAKPYSIAQVIALGNPGTSAWVKGYIVGWVEGQVLQSGAHFDANATVQTNLLLADNKGETDLSKCIPVQLAYGTEARTALNLQDHPGNFGKELTIQGDLVKYFGVAGQKGSTAYKIDGTGGGDTPVTPPDTPDTPGTGTEFTFTSAQFSSFTLPGSSTADGFTFDIEKANGSTAPAYHANTTAIRLYADNTMAISGKKMNKIVFTLASDAKFRYTTLTPSTGKINPAQTADDTEITWEGSASEVTFTVGHDATLGSDGPEKRGQVRFTAIKIWAE